MLVQLIETLTKHEVGLLQVSFYEAARGTTNGHKCLSIR